MQINEAGTNNLSCGVEHLAGIPLCRSGSKSDNPLVRDGNLAVSLKPGQGVDQQIAGNQEITVHNQERSDQ